MEYGLASSEGCELLLTFVPYIMSDTWTFSHMTTRLFYQFLLVDWVKSHLRKILTLHQLEKMATNSFQCSLIERCCMFGCNKAFFLIRDISIFTVVYNTSCFFLLDLRVTIYPGVTIYAYITSLRPTTRSESLSVAYMQDTSISEIINNKIDSAYTHCCDNCISSCS